MLSDDLNTLIELLTETGVSTKPKGIDTDLKDSIRAHGAAAIEPLMAMIDSIVRSNYELEENWNYADVSAVEILADLPIDEGVVTRLHELMTRYPDDEWLSNAVINETPRAGAVVIGPSLTILRDRALEEFPRIQAAEMLGNTAKHHPDLRDRIADDLISVMAAVDPVTETDDDRAVNGFIMIALEETRAERYIPFIQQVFAQGRIDTTITDVEWAVDGIQGKDPMERRTRERNDADSWGESPKDFEPFQPYVAPVRPGRNDPCWCGSGKKYKKCHMREDEAQDRNDRRDRT